MLTTREFLSGIKRDYAPDVDTQDLVRYLDRLQRQVYLPTDNSKRIWLNSADPSFPYPSLVTTDGVLSYELSELNLIDSLGNPIIIDSPTGAPEEILSVLNVFTSIGSFRNNYHQGAVGYPTSFETFNLNGVRGSFIKVPCKMTDRVGDNPPSVQFALNPGDSTGNIYVEMTTAPVRITALNSPCAIDLATFEEYMTDGMVGMIERTRNGESPKWEKWEAIWVVKIRDYYNRNDDEFYDMQIGHNY